MLKQDDYVPSSAFNKDFFFFPPTRTSARPSQGSALRPLNNHFLPPPRGHSAFTEPCSCSICPQSDHKPSAHQESSLTGAGLGRQRLANVDEVVLGGSCACDGFPVVTVPCQGREVEGVAGPVSGGKRTLRLGSPGTPGGHRALERLDI